MRLWTLHPRYLDARGLCALWREALLARAVLEGRTRGYRRHPQLERFRLARDPVDSIGAYLAAVFDEASRRGYSFDRSKLSSRSARARLAATEGQLLFEWARLKIKLSRRDPAAYRRVRGLRLPEPHPLFRVVRGPVAAWERGRRRGARETR